MNLPLLLVSAALGLLILIVYVYVEYIRYIRHGTFFRFSSGVRTFGGGWNNGTDEKRQAKVATTTRGARLYIFPGSFASFVYYLSTRSSQHPLAFSLVLSFPFINTHFSLLLYLLCPYSPDVIQQLLCSQFRLSSFSGVRSNFSLSHQEQEEEEEE